MKTIIENVIREGRYDLAQMLKKIDTLWLQGDLTDEEKTELVSAAQTGAKPENSYAPLQTQIDELAAQLKALADRVAAIEAGTPGDPPVEEEWPEYVQPTGAHNAYNTGDKITFNGNHYICQMDGCVWSPAEYPTAWRKSE